MLQPASENSSKLRFYWIRNNSPRKPKNFRSRENQIFKQNKKIKIKNPQPQKKKAISDLRNSHAGILPSQQLHRHSRFLCAQARRRQFVQTHYLPGPPRPIWSVDPNQASRSSINPLTFIFSSTSHLSLSIFLSL